MGWLFTTRPLEGVIAGGLTGLWLLAVARRGLPRVVAYGAGCIATGLVYFGFNWAVTGTPLASPLQEYLSALWPGAGRAAVATALGADKKMPRLQQLPGAGTGG